MSRTSKRVFIVDDSEFFVEWISEQIGSIQGIEILGSCGSVHPCIKKIKKLDPDIIILDIRLKDGNGIDLLKNLKDQVKKYKIIVFTNYPWQVFQQQCRVLGADYFFDKSIEFGRLKETLVAMSTHQGEFINQSKDNTLLL